LVVHDGRVFRAALVVAVITPTLALADPAGGGDGKDTIPLRGADAAANDDLSLRSQIGFGASIQPNSVSFSSEAGYDGAAGKAVASGAVEATLYKGLSVRASAEMGGLVKDNYGRPAIGAAYQFLDPRTSPIGLRVSVTYKPEGFTEPEGEIESVAVVTRLIGKDSVRAFTAFGSDADNKENDGEVGGSYLHSFGDNFVAGGMSRYRRAFKVKTGSGEPNWDVTAGGIASYQFMKQARVELFVGDETLNVTGATNNTGTKSGVLSLLGFGLDI
jgi:hypothetical protein